MFADEEKKNGYVGGEKGGRKGRIKTKRQKESERAIFVELWYIYLLRFKIIIWTLLFVALTLLLFSC